jgi:error-prone DNA polymerase
LRGEAAQALLQARGRAPLRSIDDLALRVPELRKNELALLAEIGALNAIGRYESDPKPHRRDALWQIERASRRPGPLLEGIVEQEGPSPLPRMSDEERLVADFRGTGLTVGPHPMAYRRREMDRRGIRCARDLPLLPDGKRVRTAGAVIARQRPGTASGFVFLSLEDETGIANAIVTPDLFEQHRLTLVSEQFLLIEGVLQNRDNVVSVKAERIMPLQVTEAWASSHDFR